MKKKIIFVMLAAMLLLTGCEDKEKKENQEAYRQIGINRMADGDYEGAIEAFQSALDQSLAKIGDTELDICYYKAEAEYRAGKVEDAITTYSSLIAYDKKNAEVYYLRGTLYLAEGEKKDALADYEKAARYGSDEYELYVNIAGQLSANGEEDKSTEYLKDALDISGKSAEDYTWRGRIYLMMEDYDKAKDQLEKALDEESPDAQLYLGELYEAQGDSDAAKKAYESYAKENADNPEVLENLASLAAKQEDYEQAITYLKTALETDEPENEQSLRQSLIQAYENSGDFDSAKEQMESYVKDYPNDEDAQREYTFLQTR